MPIDDYIRTQTHTLYKKMTLLTRHRWTNTNLYTYLDIYDIDIDMCEKISDAFDDKSF